MQLDEAALVDLIEHAVRAATAPLHERLFALEARGIAIDGKDGAQGPQGERGAQGEQGEKGADGLPGLSGRDGLDGVNGKDGKDGVDGKDGAAGPAGIGITAAAIDAEGCLLLTFDDGRLEKVGLVVGQKGADGREGLPGVPGRPGDKGADGIDGLGFDDIEVEHDGERAFTFVFKRGDRRKVCGAFKVPAQVYRGVYEEGKAYERGDTVTWGGSQWHANADTKAKPGGSDASSRAWQLCVKKGSDGKPGAAGKDGQGGKAGKDGAASWPR